MTPLGRAGFIRSHSIRFVANTYHPVVAVTSTSSLTRTLYNKSTILQNENIKTDFVGISKLTTLKMTTRRTSTRLKKTVVQENEKDDENSIDNKIEDKEQKSARKTKRKTKDSATTAEHEEHGKSKKKKVTTVKKKSATTKKAGKKIETGQEPTSPDIKTIKKKASDHQRITERDTIPKLWDERKAREEFGSYS